MWHHLQQGGSWPLVSSCWIDVTECGGRVKTGNGTAERESGGRWEGGGVDGGGGVPWCIWIDKCLFWLLRMELNCRSEETSKHNSGLTSIGWSREEGIWQCAQAASTALRLSCWRSRAISWFPTQRDTELKKKQKKNNSVKVRRCKIAVIWYLLLSADLKEVF